MILQSLAGLPAFPVYFCGGIIAVVANLTRTPSGLSVREDENPITGNTSRFLPHATL